MLRSKLAMRSVLRFDVALFEQWDGSGNVKLFSNHGGEMSKRTLVSPSTPPLGIGMQVSLGMWILTCPPAEGRAPTGAEQRWDGPFERCVPKRSPSPRPSPVVCIIAPSFPQVRYVRESWDRLRAM